MDYYKTGAGLLPGSNYAEVYRRAKEVFAVVKGKTKRKPYIRSKHFDREKIFFDYFWVHLYQKPPRERMKRLKYVAAALEVLHQSQYPPKSIVHRHNQHEMLHRFAGVTPHGQKFFVQVKETISTGTKQFMSTFPEG